VPPLFCTAPSPPRAGTLDGIAFISNSFWCNAREASLLGAVSLFKFRHIEHLVVAAITEFVVHRALPLMSRFEKQGLSTGDRWFSISLQRRVCKPSVPRERFGSFQSTAVKAAFVMSTPCAMTGRFKPRHTEAAVR
jgi:hypothetical protein